MQAESALNKALRFSGDFRDSSKSRAKSFVEAWQTAQSPEAKLELVQEVRFLLAEGRPSHSVHPYVFRYNTQHFAAVNLGLSGFIYSEQLYQNRFGESASARQLGNYLNYVLDTLIQYPWASEICEVLQDTQDKYKKRDSCPTYNFDREYLDFIGTLRDFEGQLLNFYRTESPAAEKARALRVCQIYPHKIDMVEARTLLGCDPALRGSFAKLCDLEFLAALKIKNGANALWPLGIFPIGEVNRKGEGSPFAHRDQLSLDRETGTLAEWQQMVANLKSLKMPLGTDGVFNHTSPDSNFLFEHPEAYIANPHDSNHHFEVAGRKIMMGGFRENGRLGHWSDTAQLDITHPETFQYHLRYCEFLIEKLGSNFIRVDAADQLLNSSFRYSWGDLCHNPESLEGEEYLSRLVNAVKLKHPDVVFVFESYSRPVSIGGIADLRNNKANQGEHGRHFQGFSDTLKWNGQRPFEIQHAIDRAIAADNILVECALLTSAAEHDMPSPMNSYPRWTAGAVNIYAAQFLATHLPGAIHHFFGYEFLAQDPDPHGDINVKDGKGVRFDERTPLRLSTNKDDRLAIYIQQQLRQGGLLKELNPQAIDISLTLEPYISQGLVGWLYQTKDCKYLVLCNTSNQPILDLSIKDPHNGLNVSLPEIGCLENCGLVLEIK